VFDCTCNTQNSLLSNQHNGDDAPQERVYKWRTILKNGNFVNIAPAPSFGSQYYECWEDEDLVRVSSGPLEDDDECWKIVW